MTEDSQPFAQSVHLPDMAATEALGARIAAGLETGDAVALEGDLGAARPRWRARSCGRWA